MSFDEAMKELIEIIDFLKENRDQSILYDYNPYQDKECTWTEEQKKDFMKKLDELDPLL